ncbi:hypothetical protein WAF17_12145 [Bernardetia sp. ABR2-2B]|uniref:hypothetical protein n=1 Tax=Bernardetia sp. ABR2-2B TaxID=3127472 RepID=UPI0030D2C766
MVLTEYKTIFDDFIKSFNKMCGESGHTYLVRQQTYNYETGSRTVDEKYKVKYKHDRKDNTWEIYATPRSWFSFKKFPLIKLEFSDKIVITGIATNKIDSIVENNVDSLKKLLKDYQEKVRNLNPDTFARL